MLQYFQDLPDWIRYIITASVVVISIVHYLLWIHRPKKHLETSELAVVITGCDTGFGNLLAKELHSLGFKVVATFLTEEGMKSLQNHVDLALKCDVTIDSDIEKLYKATDEFLNTKNLKLWAVVNNAGVGMGGYLDWLSLARFKFIMEVNFFGVLKVTKAMLPLLKRTKESRIITLSSVAGVIGGPGFGGYSASKHALEGAMKCFRIELRPWNIHVCNINPAYMNTPIIANSEQSRLRIFKEAPVEVQNQYDMNVKLTPPVGEDPMLVVNEIARIMYDKKPSFNNYVGTKTRAIRIFNMLPAPIKEYLASKYTTVIKPTKEAIQSIQKN